mgnify:CR=1 FL=1
MFVVNLPGIQFHPVRHPNGVDRAPDEAPMKKVLLLNGGKKFAHSDGRYNTTLHDAALAVLREAVALGVFGAPTFILNGERFWGQDRLDFLERHLKNQGD